MVESGTILRRMTRGAIGGVLVAAAVSTAAPAFAQANAKASDQSPWVKICNNAAQNNGKQICLITQELRTDTGQFLASVALRETQGEARRVVLASVPVGFLLQQGLKLRVDENKEQTAAFQICFPNACYAELPVDASFIDQLKKGKKLRLTALNQQAKPVNFEMTLSGFTDTYNGTGIDPAALQARQKQLENQLAEKAKEARQKIIDAQKAAGVASTAPQTK